MKRRIRPHILVLMMFLSAGAACDRGPGDAAKDSARAETLNGWTQTVVIGQAERRGTTIMVQGRAAPEARVVLRGPQGEAYAASADEEGAFDLRMTQPARDQLYRAEVQSGQDAARSADWLLVTTSPSGVLAVMTPGEASRRLDRRALLEAVDHDGGVMLASGHAAPDATVEVNLDGRAAGTARAGADGRWVASLGSRSLEPALLSVISGQRRMEVAYPGPGTPGEPPLSLESLPGGDRVLWAAPGGARQSTWFVQIASPPR